MIGVLVVFEARPGKELELEETLKAFVKKVLKREKGIGYFDLYKHMGSEQHFAFFEQYESEEVFRAHGDTKHFKELEAKLGELLATPPGMNVHNLVT